MCWLPDGDLSYKQLQMACMDPGEAWSIQQLKGLYHVHKSVDFFAVRRKLSLTNNRTPIPS